jgi:hypothetical protein
MHIVAFHFGECPYHTKQFYYASVGRVSLWVLDRPINIVENDEIMMVIILNRNNSLLNNNYKHNYFPIAFFFFYFTTLLVAQITLYIASYGKMVYG